MAACISPTSLTFVIPKLLPPSVGFTKQGRPTCCSVHDNATFSALFERVRRQAGFLQRRSLMQTVSRQFREPEQMDKWSRYYDRVWQQVRDHLRSKVLDPFRKELTSLRVDEILENYEQQDVANILARYSMVIHQFGVYQSLEEFDIERLSESVQPFVQPVDMDSVRSRFYDVYDDHICANEPLLKKQISIVEKALHAG